MKYPLLPVVAAFGLGICLESWVAWRTVEAALALAAFVVVACVAAWKARRLLLPCVLLAITASGLLAALLHRPRRAPALDAGPDETVSISGCVVDPALLSDGRDQFTLELARRARARVSLAIRPGETAPRLDYGQRVEIEAKVRSPHNFENPGEFDYRAFLAGQNIYWTASMHPGSVPRILPGSCGRRAAAWIYRLRAAATNRLDELYSGKPFARGLLEAILLGERRRLEPDWEDDFRRAGTYHVLVVAGLHLAAFTAFFLFLLRLCFLRQVPALALTSAAAWIFVLITGGSTPVLRAASGFTLYVVARFFSRRGRVLNLLAGVALIFLVVDPHQIFDAGFQLSFLSVLSIGALGVPFIEATSGPFQRGLRAISEAPRDLRLAPEVAQFRVEVRLVAETLAFYVRMPVRWLETLLGALIRLALTGWELAIVSAAIQAGLALPMALYFHRVSLAGISANVLVVPLMSFVVPIGFLAVITKWHVLAAAAGWLVEVSGRVSLWHAQAGPDWRVPNPPLWLSVLLVTSLIVLALALGTGSVGWQKAFRTAAFLSTGVLFGLLLWQPFPPQVDGGELEVTAIDVGQGDSLLVAFPDRTLMVVDAGGIPAFRGMPRSRLDIGEEVVAPYLWSRSVRKIDILVLTHAHADHAGGMAALIQDFRPRELWTGANSDNPSWDAVRRQALRYGVRIHSLRAGKTLVIGGARVSILAPPQDYLPDEEPKNNDSLVMRVQYKERSFLLTGDAESAVEERLLADGLAGRVDVLKVGHHGSRTSSTEAFLDTIQPAFAMISDGAGNPFHHPHPDVVRRLQAHHSEVLRTDLDGLIRFRTDGRRLQLDTFERDRRASGQEPP